MPKNKAHKKCTCDQKSMLKRLVKGQTSRETRPPTPAGATKGHTIVFVLLGGSERHSGSCSRAEQRGAADRPLRHQHPRHSAVPWLLLAVSRSHHAIRDGSRPKSKSRIILKVQFSLLCLLPLLFITPTVSGISPRQTSPCLAPARWSLVGVLVVSRWGQKRALMSRKPNVTPAVPDPQSPSVEAVHNLPEHQLIYNQSCTRPADVLPDLPAHTV